MCMWCSHVAKRVTLNLKPIYSKWFEASINYVYKMFTYFGSNRHSDGFKWVLSIKHHTNWMYVTMVTSPNFDIGSKLLDIVT